MLMGVGEMVLQERYDRLAGEEAERLAARRATLKEEVYGSMHFRPQLNPRSVAMAPSGSGGVEGLASFASKQQQRLAELSRAEEDRQRQQCTFQVSCQQLWRLPLAGDHS